MVVGANSILYANTMQQFYKLGMLSPEGKCKSFDASGNGCSFPSLPLPILHVPLRLTIPCQGKIGNDGLAFLQKF